MSTRRPRTAPSGAPARSIDAAVEAIRSHGGRMTPAKHQVLDVLLHETDDITAETLCERLPQIDHATIYRTLGQLEAAGVIHHRHLAHGPAGYRWAREPTIAVVCEGCGHVVELGPSDFSELAARARAHGMVLSRGHFALSGRCQRCS